MCLQMCVVLYWSVLVYKYEKEDRSGSVSVGPLGPRVHRFCLRSPLASMGFDSKCNFTPATILLGQ